MDKVKKCLSIGILAALVTAVAGEEILCFIRAYSELWYTILVPGLIVIALAVVAYVCRKLRSLNVVASAIVIAGSILLIGFPSYVMYLGLILGGLSLVAEIAELVLYILQKRKNNT